MTIQAVLSAKFIVCLGYFLGAYVKREFLNLTKCMRRIRIRTTRRLSHAAVCESAGETRLETTEQ